MPDLPLKCRRGLTYIHLHSELVSAAVRSFCWPFLVCCESIQSGTGVNQGALWREGNLESSRACGRYCGTRLSLVAEQETVTPRRLWCLSAALICTFNVSFWPLKFPKLTQTSRKNMSDLRRSSLPGSAANIRVTGTANLQGAMPL